MIEFPEQNPNEEIMCPQCRGLWAWIGDHGVAIELLGTCLGCQPHDRAIPWAEIIAGREAREQAFARRALPCPICLPHGYAQEYCPRCQGRGWVLGYPPGYQNMPGYTRPR